MPVIAFLALMVLITGTGPATAAEPGIWSSVVGYIYHQQQAFHRELASAIRLVADQGVQAFWGLLTISFLYGVFHAAGPGHGKAIISTYVATHESRLKRATVLSVAASLLQGVTAIVLVQAVYFILGGARRDAQEASGYLEQASFVMITLIGLFLCYRVLRALFAKEQAHDHHHHAHDHEHLHDHHHHHHGDDCALCNHAHMVEPGQLSDHASWKEMVILVVSVGIRPCSGSILVLVFAEVVGLGWAGMAAVLAISLGTAATVSLLAGFAVGFRHLAVRLAQRQSSALVSKGFLVFALLGGLLISALGISLFTQSLQTSHPLF